MDPAIGGALISGGANLIGSLIGGGDSGRISSDQWEMYDSQQNYTTQRLGQGREHDVKMAEANRNHDQIMAKSSTGWAMKDAFQAADEAGIHRLAALGGASQYQGTGTGASGGGGGGMPGIPSGSSGRRNNFVGDAVGDAIRAYGQSKELKMQERESNARIKLMDAEKDGIDAATSRTQISNARSLVNSSNPDVLANTSLGELVRTDTDVTTSPEENLYAQALKGNIGPHITEMSAKNMLGLYQWANKIRNEVSGKAADGIKKSISQLEKRMQTKPKKRSHPHQRN
ncbi:hypothetical protein [Microviridae sp.]|nr:hypothetical protein [Microviridae sp.]